MLDIIEKNTVEEIKVQVTLRLVDGNPDNEITEALLPFLMKEVEKEEVEPEASTEQAVEEDIVRSY